MELEKFIAIVKTKNHMRKVKKRKGISFFFVQNNCNNLVVIDLEFTSLFRFRLQLHRLVLLLLFLFLLQQQ